MQLHSTLRHIVSDAALLVPEYVLLVASLVLLVVGFFIRKKTWAFVAHSSIFGVALAVVFFVDYTFVPSDEYPRFIFFDSLVVSEFSIKFKLLADLAAFLFLVFLLQTEKQDVLREKSLELLFVVVCMLLGAHFMVMSTNYLMMFLSLEILSVGSYILVCFIFNKFSAEASVKYVLFGMFSSGISVYGISWLYGLTGTLSFGDIETIEHLFKAGYLPAFLGILCTIVGLLFKMSVFPMQFWVPDVYEHTPAPLVAFLSAVNKIAALGVCFNLISVWYGTWGPGFDPGVAIGIIACITIAFGNFGAYRQKSFQRMLAYSAIAHTGFLILPFCGYSKSVSDSVFFYLFTYIWLNFGVFFLAFLLKKYFNARTLEQMSGLGQQYPVLGVYAVVILMALVGIPPTSGFMAKLLIFSSVFDSFRQQNNWAYSFFLVFGLANTVVSLFFYLKPLYYMFLKNPSQVATFRLNIVAKVYLLILAISAVIFFFIPSLIIS